MRLSGRQQRILRALDVGGYAEVKTLAARLSVDVSTVRRDLQELTRLGYVARSHGGVQLAVELDRFSEYEPRDVAEISAIVRAATRLIVPGSRIALGTGTIAGQIARDLAEVPDLTVLTNSLNVVNALAGHDSVRVLFAGGELRAHDADLLSAGNSALAQIQAASVDLAFVDADGITDKHGATTFTPWISAVQNALLRSAKTRVVLGLSRVFGVVGTAQIIALNEVDLFLTGDVDDAVLPEFGGRVARSGVQPLPPQSERSPRPERNS